MFIVTFGGTGATLVVPFMFMWMTKSKRNKAIDVHQLYQHFWCKRADFIRGTTSIESCVLYSICISATRTYGYLNFR